MPYYDNHGNKLELTSKLGEGGEGAVFRISGNKYFVAKIYHTTPSLEQAEKLAWMCDNAPESVRAASAWPNELIFDKPGGLVVGFRMPSIEGRQVFELYSPRLRRANFPKANWGFLVRTAKNLAIAFKQIHDSGHVIGDVNHGNCVVFPDGTVKLIDCDSYSIRAKGKLFPCEVGVSTHLPPELQNTNLRGKIRTTHHDNFGLAVLIFQLLFLGRHPFSGKGSGANNKTLEECISENLFVYGRNAGKLRLQHPPGAPELSAVSPEVSELFEKAFGSGEQRPSSTDWIENLHGLERRLKRCDQNPEGHVFFNGLSSCPWCELETQTGALLFPFDFQVGSTGFDIKTIEDLLDSLQPELTLAPRAAREPLPISGIGALLQGQLGVKPLGLVVTQAIVVGVIYHFLSIPLSISLGFAIALAYYFTFGRADGALRKQAKLNLQLKQREWAVLEAAWALPDISFQVSHKKKWLREKIADYKKLPILLQNRLQELESNVRTQQLNTYLDQFSIARASIQGIGPNRVATLQSYGISTAADVDRSIAGISGFGPTYTSKLLQWRAALEAAFQYDPTKGVRESDRHAVQQQVALSTFQLERLLKKESTELVSLVSSHNINVSQLYKREQHLKRELKVAHSNRLIHFRHVPMIAALSIIPLLIPICFIAVHVANNPPQRQIATMSNANQMNSSATSNRAMQNQTVDATNISSSNSNLNANVVANSNTNASPESLPELAGLDVDTFSEIEKENKARELFDKGVELARSKRSTLAIRYYREAIALDDKRAIYRHEYGYLLYSMKRFREAASELSTADRLGSSDRDTKLYLALSNFALKNWKDAEAILSKYVQSDSDSYIAQFHLGIAARNLGDIPSSVNALERAVYAKPNSAAGHYELARSYIQAGRIEHARFKYELLLRISPELAQKLLSELDQ